MSRGGRGGGRGGFTKTNPQFASLGVNSAEGAPMLVTQPPPLYPLLARRPVPLTQSSDLDYLVVLRQDYIDHMQLSSSFLKKPQTETESTNEIDRLLSQLPQTKGQYEWNLLPAELRPKVLAKRNKVNAVSKNVDIQETLFKLEKMESEGAEETKENEAAEDDEEELKLSEPEDEEMDDGTDYANNYFDNGEAYEDEEDNLDDGPVY